MAKMIKLAKATTSTGDDALAVVAYGDAVALGEDTLTSVSASITVTGNGAVTRAKGEIESIAVAESPTDEEFAFAVNDVIMSGGDVVIVKTKSRSFDGDGESYFASTTKFIAINVPVDLKNPVLVEIDNDMSLDDGDVYIDLEGNTSIAEFDVQAYGEDSLATVDVYSLAIEDEMSLATILAVAATG